MRRVWLRLVIPAVLMGGASVAFGRLDGPPPSRTGAFPVGTVPAEPLCTVCHNTYPPNDSSGSVEILDLPDTYLPGQEYPLRVRVTHTYDPLPPSPVYGFQFTAVRADSGTGFGTFLIPGTLKLVSATTGSGFDTRQYVEHSAVAAHVNENPPVEWSFTWKSPDYYAAEKVYFFAAGNAADGSGGTQGDYIFTAVDSMTFGASLGVTPLLTAHTSLGIPQPNPFDGHADFSYSIAKAGAIDLSVYDLQGRKVRTLIHERRGVGPGMTAWDGLGRDGRPVSNGIYFVRLAAPDAEPIVRKVTLSR